ncbi:hypothetical protein HWV62_6843 [Athelia sp. TMB]|nr:hypothetical protein HWV62_6843 [Athelia sp. TMB]
MAVSSYIPHLIYSVALTSFSFHLLFHRKQVDQDRAHIAAQTTILTSLATQLRSGPVPEAEVERLLRLAKTHEFQDSVITKEKEKAKIGWGDVFLGRENDPESESAQERETKALKARRSLFKVTKTQFNRRTGVFTEPFISYCTERDKPIRLDIDKDDLEKLLKVIYSVKRPEHLGRDGWESVLKTSTKWGLLDIRNMAIRALLHCSVDAIDRISLGRIYGIPYWMRTGYLHLSRREDAISEEEGMRLGAKSLSRLCWIREKSHTCFSTSDDYRSGPPYRQRVLVNTLFADEFEEAETAWACTESMLPSPALSSELSSEWLDTAVSQPIPNEVFYIAHVIFQVDEYLFKAVGPDIPLEGSNDQHPIKLHGVNANSFRSFLTLLIPG